MVARRFGGRFRKRFQPFKPKSRHRLNENITAPTLRVVSASGELVGIMPSSQALALAKEQEIDLVEISPKADPPVAKLIEYGKMLYSLKKKEHQTRQASKGHDMKGIRITFLIDEGDLARQKEKAKEFLLTGHPVRIQMVLRGRENAHKDLALAKIHAFIEDLADCGQADQLPSSGGRQLVAILKPLGKSATKTAATSAIKPAVKDKSSDQG